MDSFIKRLTTGLLLLFTVCVCFYLGGFYSLILCFILTFLAIGEMTFALENANIKLHIYSLRIVSILILIISHFYGIFFGFLGLLLYMFYLLIDLTFFERVELPDILASSFMLLYIAIPFSIMNELTTGKYVFLAFACAWGTDTFAYVFGMLFGKHRLAPKISPKKSIEGAVFGTIFSLFVSGFFIYIFKMENAISLYIICFFGSILAQIGDLCASKIKRISKIKDYGYIFRGHGGVLDRFDSVIFSSVFIYIVLMIKNM